MPRLTGILRLPVVATIDDRSVVCSHRERSFDLSFAAMPKRTTPAVDLAIDINVPSDAVFKAFFDHDALRIWRRTERSVTTPRVLGPFAIEWLPAAVHDEVLG